MPREPLNKNPNKVFYNHLRYKDDEGTSNFGGITIAYREHENGLAFEVAFSRCHINDNFCKRVGRAIALGNLNFDRLYIVNRTEKDIKKERDHIVAFVVNKLRAMEAPYQEETLH